MLHYPCPGKMYMMANRDDTDVKTLFELGFTKRPSEELFNLKIDPFQMKKVAYYREYVTVKKELSQKLENHLKEKGILRILAHNIIWDITQ